MDRFWKRRRNELLRCSDEFCLTLARQLLSIRPLGRHLLRNESPSRIGGNWYEGSD